MKKTISFIGAGNMSTAMVGGVLKGELVEPDQIYVSGRSAASLKTMVSSFGVNTSQDNSKVVHHADIVIFCVKPHILPAVAAEVSPQLKPGTLLISVAAGTTISTLEKLFGKEHKIIRCMPNTPALVGEGMTALCGNKQVTGEDMQQALQIFSSFGRAEQLEESLFDAFTGLCGSSPAYIFMILEAMADGAVAEGIPRAQAYTMAAQTLLGSATMLLQTGKHPGELKDMVTSPGGTTIEAVAKLEEKGLRSALIDAVRCCSAKSRAMSSQ